MSLSMWSQTVGRLGPWLSILLILLGLGQIAFARRWSGPLERATLSRFPWLVGGYGALRDSVTPDSRRARFLQPPGTDQRELLDGWRSMRLAGYLIGCLWIVAGLWGLYESF